MNYIAVASRVGAHIFRLNKSNHQKQLELVKELSNPLGRERNREFQNDKPGMSRAKYFGSAPHRLDGEKNPHDDAADQFASHLVEVIKQMWIRNPKIKFQIVAGPNFMGMLRRHLNDSPFEKDINWVNKNLENVPQQQWPKLLGLEERTPPPEVYIHSNRTLSS